MPEVKAGNQSSRDSRVVVKDGHNYKVATAPLLPCPAVTVARGLAALMAPTEVEPQSSHPATEAGL